MIQDQIKSFIIFFILGYLIGYLYEFFKALRRNFKTSNKVTFIEDIIFLTIFSIMILYSIFYINLGILRSYIISGITIGLIAYILTLSKAHGIILDRLVKLIKNITKKLTSYYK